MIIPSECARLMVTASDDEMRMNNTKMKYYGISSHVQIAHNFNEAFRFMYEIFDLLF